MPLLRAFLRNLAIVLVVGSVGFLALRLPFSPWISALLYAAALAALMTWGEHAPPPRNRSRRNGQRDAGNRSQRRPRAASRANT
ncbi:hypothetical protein [Roseicella aerolata]|uniref:Uncharacterized protein n=1 Tax=Roseicella aerolata TaxID=2883479 RepID=A0A9X1LCT2_9PROT|nr:hypothetical protein [Roseicella aerolata]MCB4823972.1 hypothetical protein [Roseicella aerolata]